jgi:glycosyltransferase involved in cell wall biosynthesis
VSETVAFSAAPTSVPPVVPERDGVVVVVPMYNEAEIIATVVSDLRAEFPRVVCVDDGSRDASAKIAALAGATVVRHPLNLGQGAALQTGIEYALDAGAAYIVTFDADGQHRVADAKAMLDLARSHDVDVVLGSRFLQRTTRGSVPVARRLLLHAALLFTRVTTGLPLTDTHNGLRVLTRSAARRITITLNGMAHASEILGIVARERMRYAEAPIEVAYTEYSMAKGQSGLNAVNILVDLFLARARNAS